MNNIPRIAIVDPHTLAVLGLTNLLESVMPMLQIDSFGSFAELQANHPEQYFHYFVDVRVVLNNMSFFQQMRHKTIVLSSSAADDMAALSSFHTICTNLPPKLLLRSLLMLEQHAHANGRNLPPVQSADTNSVTPLSTREIEVLSLIVKGYINKEIADKLHLSLPTIITHRKNLMAKLDIHSVSALTIYAVMHGYVGVNEI